MTEVIHFTIQNIYIAVAIPLIDKNSILMKVNEKIQERQNESFGGVS